MAKGFNLFHSEPYSALVRPPVALEESGHRCCEKRFPEEMCGPAVTDCVEDTVGRFWVTNSEYATQVNFCPFCGMTAPLKAAELPQDQYDYS